MTDLKRKDVKKAKGPGTDLTIDEQDFKLLNALYDEAGQPEHALERWLNKEHVPKGPSLADRVRLLSPHQGFLLERNLEFLAICREAA